MCFDFAEALHSTWSSQSLPPRDTTCHHECCWCELPCWLFSPQPVLILPSPCSFLVHLLCRLLTRFQRCCFLNQAPLAPQQYFCLSKNSCKCWHFPLATLTLLAPLPLSLPPGLWSLDFEGESHQSALLTSSSVLHITPAHYLAPEGESATLPELRTQKTCLPPADIVCLKNTDLLILTYGLISVTVCRLKTTNACAQ